MKRRRNLLVIALSAAASLALVACASSPSSSDETAGAGGQNVPAAGSGNVPNGGNDDNGACSELVLPADQNDVIATFEDGLGSVNQDAPGRGGGFYAFNDGTGTQTPPANSATAPTATSISHCESTYALCTNGSGFSTWGAGIGTDIGKIDAATGKKTPYDATQYKGVAFWAKSNAGETAVKVKFPDKNTAEEGGVCDSSVPDGPTACYNDWSKTVNLTEEWQAVTITFSELQQETWGAIYDAFDITTLYALQFQVGPNIAFDFCIDDLIFVR
ncbi:MAG: hypothetical protein JXA30_13790 [Deltaproteobacteria bacterium]|nr:hypothetical protein [Deltaproteobacteria bacterium]